MDFKLCDPPILIMVEALVLPPAPVAVAVYVVVLDGLTETDPEVATLPTPGSMSTDVALVVDQDRVALWPEEIVAGDELN